MIAVKDLVEAKLYETEEAVWHDALGYLLRYRPEVRLRLAIHRYQTEAISLGKAAELAGVSWVEMRDILHEQGIPLALGPATVEELEQEINALRTHLASQKE